MPTDLRGKLDMLITDYRVIDALKLLMAELKPRPSLSEAEDLVARRRNTLGLPARRASPPPDIEALWAQLTALQPEPVALEARWDGDTHGWFVILEAILPLPSQTHARYTAQRILTIADEAGDMRLFSGGVPPWPEARSAATIGEELARRLGVPFCFTSPESPDDLAPRWWDLSP